MKTLLLFILLQIPGVLTLNPSDFIDKPASEFISYCTNHNIDVQTECSSINFYNATINENITICFFDDKIKALKVYFPKSEYNIHEVGEALKDNLYLVKKGIYIDIENPRFLYGLINYENEAFFALIIYKHGN